MNDDHALSSTLWFFIQDGYESSSQASSGSTRSISSSFLRYHNRTVWKARLTKKTILQRLGDGSETPVENEARPWPIFDRVYRRQNQLKKGDLGEEVANSDDDNDSVSSEGSDIRFEEEPFASEVKFEQPDSIDELKRNTQEHGISGTLRSFLVARTSFYSESSAQLGRADLSPKESLVELYSVFCVQGGPLDSTSETVSPSIAQRGDIDLDAEKEPASDHTDVKILISTESFDGSLKSEPQIPPVTFQESGITTFEAPKSPQTGDDSESNRLLTNKQDNEFHPSTSNIIGVAASETPSAAAATPSRRSRRLKKKVSADDSQRHVVPRSIPPTINYSLRSAIGDGSVRQRNNHSFMERRPLRPNGCAVDVSYWSHRGKRHYMEGKCISFMILRYFHLSPRCSS
jgi:hypothetical protein